MKKNLAKILFILFLSFLNQLSCVVILVHGPYESHSSWCNPGGNFYKELENSAKSLNQNLIPFSWSGLPTDEQIIKGAESLARVILSYPSNEKIIIIGHGHGSNVINFATQLIFDPKHDTSYTTTDENNVPTDVSILISQAYKNTQKGIVSEKTQLVKNALENVIKWREEHDLKNSTENTTIQPQAQQISNIKKYLIEKVCLISPAVDMEKFSPQMNIIKNVYGYYSTSNPTITIFGHEKLYPKQDRIVNFKVQFLNCESFTLYSPTPIEMLNPIIARWILFIPEKLQEEKIGFFENFTYLQNAKIQFAEGKRPIYLSETK